MAGPRLNLDEIEGFQTLGIGSVYITGWAIRHGRPGVVRGHGGAGSLPQNHCQRLPVWGAASRFVVGALPLNSRWLVKVFRFASVGLAEWPPAGGLG